MTNCNGCERRRAKLKHYLDKILSFVPGFNKDRLKELKLGEARMVAIQLGYNNDPKHREELYAILTNKAAEEQQEDGK